MTGDLIFALEHAAWPALLVDISGRIRRANASALKAFGSGLEKETAPLAAIWADENELPAEAQISRWDRLAASNTSIRFKLKDGSTSLLQAWVSPITVENARHFLVQLFTPQVSGAPPANGPGASFPMDTSAFRRPDTLEASIVQKQKLDCALQLTRTVALDFNNALTSILGHTSLLLSKMEPSHPWRNSLVEVEKSAAKAAEIAHDLATFSLQEKDSRAHVAGNLNDLLRRTVELFQANNRNVLWLFELEPRLYTVTFDEAKIQQAFVKVLDNAVQASRSDGRILVRTRNHDVAETYKDGTARLTSGCYVCVEVSDNGCGIAPEVLPRIFEPFFTTKKDQSHRGLGLAWVYGIVTNHGGSVTVSSQPGQGTSARIYLPANRKIVKDIVLKEEDLSGSQTILMIDDEDLLLTMGETILSSYGYRVLTANSGQKALEIFSNAPSAIDLVITDLVMPKMSGREVIEHLRKIAPEVRIICSSGYVRGSSPAEEESYLQKPFTSQDLLRKVKEALAHS
ncbi:MAG: ATP-binding protein [Verrucomicrobiota bacterium]